MSASMRCFVVGVVCVAGSIAAPAHSQIKPYPVKPVRVIVPFAAGGGSDLSARQVAARLSAHLGQQFVIDNRGGGGGLIGMETTARSAPDGYTIMFSSASYAAAMAIRKSSYDLLQSLTPIVEVAASPYVVAVHPTLPGSMKGLLDLARAKPGHLAYASTGAGGLTHLATELLLNMAQVRITHVPYKGAGAALPDVIAGRSPILMTPPIALLPHFQSDRLRALAVTGAARSPELPGVPLVADTVPGYVVHTWYAMFAPAGTPRVIVDKLNTLVNQILADREMKKNFEAQGMEAIGGPPEKLGAIVREDYLRWSKVVKDNNITAE